MGGSELFKDAVDKHKIVDEGVLHKELASLTPQDWRQIANDYPRELAIANRNVWVENQGDKVLVHNEENIRQDKLLTSVGDFVKGIFWTGGGTAVGAGAARFFEGEAMRFGVGGAVVGLGIAYVCHRMNMSPYDEMEKTANPLKVQLTSDEKLGMLEEKSKMRARMLGSDIDWKAAMA